MPLQAYDTSSPFGETVAPFGETVAPFGETLMPCGVLAPPREMSPAPSLAALDGAVAVARKLLHIALTSSGADAADRARLALIHYQNCAHARATEAFRLALFARQERLCRRPPPPPRTSLGAKNRGHQV